MIKQKYHIHIRHLNQALTHELVLSIGHAVFKLDQKAFIKPHIDIKAELKKIQKMILKICFWIDDQLSFWKVMKNVRKL